MNPTCYMMVGVPGSGKSTASEQLIKDIPELVILSTDQYIEDYATKHGKTYNEVYRIVGDDAQKWMNLEIKKLIKEKKHFIWDQTNVFESARKRKVNMLRQNKYDVVAIVVEISLEELNKRLKKRKDDGGKSLSWKIIQDMLENYKRPSYDEGFIDIYLIQENNEPLLLPKNEKKNQI